VRVHRVLRPQHGAETPRVAQPQHAIAEDEIEVIVLFRRRPRRQHTQAPGHAQVQDEVAIAAVDEQVLASPLDAAHLAPREQANRVRHRPAQPRLPDFDARNHAAGEMRREAAARDFDFREFGHDGLACAGHQIYLRSVESRC